MAIKKKHTTKIFKDCLFTVDAISQGERVPVFSVETETEAYYGNTLHEAMMLWYYNVHYDKTEVERVTRIG